MKRSELLRLFKKFDVKLYKHGSNHDIYISPINGSKITVPRHCGKEIPTGTAKSILKTAGIKS